MIDALQGLFLQGVFFIVMMLLDTSLGEVWRFLLMANRLIVKMVVDGFLS